MRSSRKPSARPSIQSAGVLVPRGEEGTGFPQNSFSLSSSRTRRRKAVISASISRGSGRPPRTAWRLSRSNVTHRPTTDSPSPQSRDTDAICRPRIQHQTRNITTILRRITTTSSHTRHLIFRRQHTRLTKCQQHQPEPSSSSRTSTSTRNPNQHPATHSQL